MLADKVRMCFVQGKVCVYNAGSRISDRPRNKEEVAALFVTGGARVVLPWSKQKDVQDHCSGEQQG